MKIFRFEKQIYKNMVGFALTFFWIIQLTFVFDNIRGAHVSLGLNIGSMSLDLSLGYWENTDIRKTSYNKNSS